jgi:hypothetical protein
MQVRPIVHYPPLFSLLMAGLNILSVDVLMGARIIDVVAYGLNGCLLGLLLWRATRSMLAAFAGVALFLCTPAIFSIHSMAWTDGPYLSLTMIALCLMAAYLAEPRPPLLFFAGLAAGLAYLLRYVGIALVLVLVTSLWLGSKERMRKRLLQVGLLLAVSMAPIGLWFLRNLVLTGRISDLRWWLHDRIAVPLTTEIETILDWFLPGPVMHRLAAVPAAGGALVLLAVLVVSAGGVMLLRGWGASVVGDAQRRAVLGVGGLHLGIYLAVLTASATLAFPPAIISERLLAPAYLSAVLLAVVVMHALWVRRHWLLRVAVAGAYAMLLFNKASWTASLVDRALVDGPQGYTDSRWRTSETIEALRGMDSTVVYTNNVAALYIILGLHAYDLPEEVEVPRADIDPNYETLAEYRMRVSSTPGAVVVLFGGSEVLPGAPLFAPFTEGLTLVSSYADGAIYTRSGHGGAQ